MSAADDAQTLVNKLDALHTKLLQAWNTASDGDDDARTADLKTQSDRCGDQLLIALQRLLSAIDASPDVADLTARMGDLAASIDAAQQSLAGETDHLTTVSAVLDGVDKLIGTADKAADA